MALTPDKMSHLTRKRRLCVRRRGYPFILDSHCDEETGAGVILAQSEKDTPPEAFFFRPRAHKTCFRTLTVDSAHLRLGLKDRLRQMLVQERELRLKPHDLVVGDLISCVLGANMRRASFYRVIDIPHPRKVTLAPIPFYFVSGDWMSGEVLPDLAAEPDRDKAETRKVWMTTGTARVDGDSPFETRQRWSGGSISVYCD